MLRLFTVDSVLWMIVHYKHSEGRVRRTRRAGRLMVLRSCAAAFSVRMGRGAACGAPGARQDRWFLLIQVN